MINGFRGLFIVVVFSANVFAEANHVPPAGWPGRALLPPPNACATTNVRTLAGEFDRKFGARPGYFGAIEAAEKEYADNRGRPRARVALENLVYLKDIYLSRAMREVMTSPETVLYLGGYGKTKDGLDDLRVIRQKKIDGMNVQVIMTYKWNTTSNKLEFKGGPDSIRVWAQPPWRQNTFFAALSYTTTTDGRGGISTIVPTTAWDANGAADPKKHFHTHPMRCDGCHRGGPQGVEFGNFGFDGLANLPKRDFANAWRQRYELQYDPKSKEKSGYHELRKQITTGTEPAAPALRALEAQLAVPARTFALPGLVPSLELRCRQHGL